MWEKYLYWEFAAVLSAKNRGELKYLVVEKDARLFIQVDFDVQTREGG